METLEGEQAVRAHNAALEQERLVEEARSSCRPYPEEVAEVRTRLLGLAMRLRAYSFVLEIKFLNEAASGLVAISNMFWLRAIDASLREPKDIAELLDRVCELIEFDIVRHDVGLEYKSAMAAADCARDALCSLVDKMRARAPEALR